MAETNQCTKHMSFAECELAILRAAVDQAGERQGRQVAKSPEVKLIIGIVEEFLRIKQLMCYGGTATNNILPKEAQFYNKNVEIPDYDAYSPDGLKDAKELVDLYLEIGFEEVEAKSAQHIGTFKVYVNFIPVADITTIPIDLFNALKRDSIKVAGILYAPANLLRMNMYLELSRPAGDTSRWEKVMKRLTLLNKYYPLTPKQCSHVNFQRKMEHNRDNNAGMIYDIVRKTLVDENVVFFGGYALSMYAHYMPAHQRRQLLKIPDFDVLSEDPEITAVIVQERLEEQGVKHVKIIRRPGVGDVLAPHYEIKVGRDCIAFIYEPLACHSYNTIEDDGHIVRVATLDTMLSFWLAFLYVDRPYYDKDRILCMATYLFAVQEKNRLEQRGLLKRFSLKCLGHQPTVEEMRAEKAAKFEYFKQHRPKTEEEKYEYEQWFLRYGPKLAAPSNKQSPPPPPAKKTKRRAPSQPKKRKTRRRAATKK